MAGNSKRVGAIRKGKKGPLVGSGGQGKQSLAGRGPTPRAEERTGHPAARRAKRVAAGTAGPGATRTPRVADGARKRSPRGATELLVGRNPVVEALRAEIPANALYVAIGIEADERVTEAKNIAGNRGLALLEVSRSELDRMTGGLLHQGLALQVPPFQYTELDEIIGRVSAAKTFTPLLVALDGVTDPRNLGAVVRSVGAFGGHGVLVPERRSAGMTAGAWKASAGAAARVPVARATNLTRTLTTYAERGLLVVGLAGKGSLDLMDLEAATEPIILVVGSEGKGLSRLVQERCDIVVRIPISSATESLNASVAAGVALYEVARRRQANS
jgi:23S rRNA (guanosine2251-2'-O)-methyltransferase